MGFLEQDWFLAFSVVLGVVAEEFVADAEEVPHHLSSLLQYALHYADEIVEVYLDMC